MKIKPSLLTMFMSAILLSSCNQIKEFASPYTPSGISFIGQEGKITDMVLKPADSRATVMASINGSVRSGTPDTQGVLKTAEGKSILGTICPGLNKVKYSINVLGLPLEGYTDQEDSFYYDIGAMSITGPTTLNGNSDPVATKAATGSFSVTADSNTQGCSPKEVNFVVKSLQTSTDSSGKVTQAYVETSAVAMTYEMKREASGDTINVSGLSLQSGNYQVIMTITLLNDRKIEKAFMIQIL